MIGNLGDREAGPMPWRSLYVGHAEYREAFCLWAAIRRDAEPTDDERWAAFEARMAYARALFAERYPR